MRRDMQEVLERWGRWAASEEYCSLVDWPSLSVLPCHKLEPGKSKCSDEDGFAIDTCVAHMSTVHNPEDILILGLRFIGGHSTRIIADEMHITRMQVRTSLNASEDFLAGCLVAMAVRLDMDPAVILPEPLAGAQKTMLML